MLVKVDAGDGTRQKDGMCLVRIAFKTKKKSGNKSDIKGAKSSLFLFNVRILEILLYVYII
jgi:hypothetical protein